MADSWPEPIFSFTGKVTDMVADSVSSYFFVFVIASLKNLENSQRFPKILEASQKFPTNFLWLDHQVLMLMIEQNMIEYASTAAKLIIISNIAAYAPISGK